MKELRIAFIWDFSVDNWSLVTWEDGLNQALKILAEKYSATVRIIPGTDIDEIYKTIREFSPDVILGWGSLDRPSFSAINTFGVPAALCFAGGTTQHPHTENFQMFFVENSSFEGEFRQQGLPVKKAFGVNDTLFAPMTLQKRFDAFYPAAFAKWKRHDLFAEATKQNGVVCGRYLPHEKECLEVCVNQGNIILGEQPYRTLPFIYNQSISAVVTAGPRAGSQRVVLESLACNVPPIVMADHEENKEFIQEAEFGLIVVPNVDAIQNAIEVARLSLQKKNLGRQFIKAKYSAEKYADSLYAGLSDIR